MYRTRYNTERKDKKKMLSEAKNLEKDGYRSEVAYNKITMKYRQFV